VTEKINLLDSMNHRIILFLKLSAFSRKLWLNKDWPRYWRAGGEKSTICELQPANYSK